MLQISSPQNGCTCIEPVYHALGEGLDDISCQIWQVPSIMYMFRCSWDENSAASCNGWEQLGNSASITLPVGSGSDARPSCRHVHHKPVASTRTLWRKSALLKSISMSDGDLCIQMKVAVCAEMWKCCTTAVHRISHRPGILLCWSPALRQDGAGGWTCPDDAAGWWDSNSARINFPTFHTLMFSLVYASFSCMWGRRSCLDVILQNRDVIISVRLISIECLTVILFYFNTHL